MKNNKLSKLIAQVTTDMRQAAWQVKITKDEVREEWEQEVREAREILRILENAQAQEVQS